MSCFNPSSFKRGWGYLTRAMVRGLRTRAAWASLPLFTLPAEAAQDLGGFQQKSFLADTVKSPVGYPIRLRASEVPIRSLGPRPLFPDDPHVTLEAIRAFHATRLEWIYDLTPEFILSVKTTGVSVSGTANTASQEGHDLADPITLRRLAVVDLAGNPVFAPWMRSWNPPGRWLCVNNPEVKAAYVEYLKRLIAFGVQDIQRDDPAANEATVAWGGCFCQYCMIGFRKFLKESLSAAQITQLKVNTQDFDYKEYLGQQLAPTGDAFGKYDGGILKDLFLKFQRLSTLSFHSSAKIELQHQVGAKVPISANILASSDPELALAFDFLVAELPLPNASPRELYRLALAARHLRRDQTVTMPIPRQPVDHAAWVALTRKTLATVYALGMRMEAPWDTYLPPPNAHRYFGPPSDYADLYAMIRATSINLDGYEEAAATGAITSEPLSSISEPLTLITNSPAFLVLTRVVPGSKDSAIVVHLVDWSERPGVVSLKFRPEVLFAGGAFRVELVLPNSEPNSAANNATDHIDYSKRVRRTELTPNRDHTLSIPALAPWGMLILTPKSG